MRGHQHGAASFAIAPKKSKGGCLKPSSLPTILQLNEGLQRQRDLQAPFLPQKFPRLIRPFELVIKIHYPDCRLHYGSETPRYAHRRITKRSYPVYMHLASSHQNRRSNQGNHKSTSHFRRPSLEPLPFQLLPGSQARL